MLPMTITIVSISAEGGFVHADVAVDVQAISARARIELKFAIPESGDPADWQDLAYERALMMLDPA